MRTRDALLLAGFLFSLVCTSASAAAAEDVSAPPGPSRKGQTFEWRLGAKANYRNPYDPDEVAVDAAIKAPSGRELTVPAFYAEPCEMTSESAASRLKEISNLRFYLSADRWPQGVKAAFYVDDIELGNSRTGQKVVVDDFERDAKWTSAKSVKSAICTDSVHQGKHSLSLEFTELDKEKNKWPGAQTTPAQKDWSTFDTLSCWIYPRSDAKAGQIGIEFYNAAKEKFQTNFGIGKGEVLEFDRWNKVTWSFVPKQPQEKWKVSGEGAWRLRFTPMEAGEYTLRVVVKDNMGTVESAPRKFSVADSNTDGFIRVSPGDRRYLAFDSGRPYFANGFNLISRNTAEYDYFFEKMQKCGCNFVRIWMTPFSGGLESDTLGRYKQETAAAMDHMLDSARRHGVYVMMCILDYREASTRDAWDKNVYNVARGGPCETAADFFSNLTAREFLKKRLRYLIARWGASPAVHSWEFWNEVDITDGWHEAPNAVRAWHRDLSKFLRQHDPYDHLITSSFAGVYGGDILWESRRMDVVQTHRYIGEKLEDFGDIFAGCCRTFARYRKPYHIGEFGLFNPGQRLVDAEGTSLHNGLWSAIVNGSCSTPMSWWWEWIDMNGLYPHYSAVARFIKDINWPAEGFSPLKNAELSFSGPPPTTDQRLVITPKSGSFGRARHNRENTFNVDAQGNVEHSEWLSKYIHGLKNHPDLHNPQIFRLTYPQDGEFSFGIDGVSGYGGAQLRVWLDSDIALEKDLPDGDANGATVHKFDAEYSIKVPKGFHTIKVENIGKDWFVLSYYKIFNVKVPVPVELQGLQGDRTVIAWVWNTSHVWYDNMIGAKPVIAEGAQVKFWDLRPGSYRITVFDTYTGADILSKSVEITDGLRLRLPPIERDLAVKLERLPAASRPQ